MDNERTSEMESAVYIYIYIYPVYIKECRRSDASLNEVGYTPYHDSTRNLGP